MSDIPTLKRRLSDLTQFRNELALMHKAAFMASPPMPAPGGAMPPGMDPSMMQGGAPPPGMPPGADPSMMQGGGAPPPGTDPSMMQGGMPPGMDPSMMQGGAPPPGADPSQQGGAPPGADPAQQGGLSPEMLDELIGVIEELSANNDAQEKKIQQLSEAMEECMQRYDDLDKRLASLAVQAPPAAAAVP